MHRRGPALLVLFALAAAAPAVATDLPPEVVAKFTRQVQPLIVNRCAAGSCHGGPAGQEPRFERGPASARPDRLDTLANMQTFLKAVGADRDPQKLVGLLAGGHPASRAKSRLAAAPLTARERITIESWLAAVRTSEHSRRIDPAVRQVSAETAALPARNRYREMLEAAANPAELEPPQEPQGVIFRPDDGTAAEPPMAPSPPTP